MKIESVKKKTKEKLILVIISNKTNSN
jgi:hypothetical protein